MTLITPSSSTGEVDEIPGAIELDPCRPRLVGLGQGRLSLAMYDGNWRIRSHASSIVVEPPAPASVYRGTSFLAILGFVIAIGAAIHAMSRNCICSGSNARCREARRSGST